MTERGRSDFFQPTMFDLGFVTTAFNIFMNIIDPLQIGRKLVLKPIAKLLIDAFEEYKVKTRDKLETTQNAILKLIAVITIFFLLFCGAVLLYIFFYLSYMPTVIHVKPAYMQYTKICDGDSKTCDFGSKMSGYHTFPTSHLQLTKKQLMMVGQPYVLTIKLELPETPRNQELGMFMLCMDMKDKDNILKSNSCRSTMLRYRSPWLHKLKTFLLFPLYLFGYEEEKQILDIEMFSNYIDTTNPVTDIYVEIQSKVVEFYSVTLQISAHFTGLRYLIYNFPIISAIIGIIFNLTILTLITLLVWYQYDYEMEWVDEARNRYSFKRPKTYDTKCDRKESSSISTTDENVSILDNSDDKFELDDDVMLFGKHDRKTEE
ncbi:hypothetical protein PVAND_013707 [Polypedilum vanderplanki]|uniref:Seipin n=1 Tax=Polypedilum vanderplanki TaxID=319348 RepID=A0A9J6CSE1_POLVA|nr:hypothetical protein PVAND_013707 [Polypedilum vanderplanki]